MLRTEKGLLPEPERPGRNVAWYDESFIERIRLIKELQQQRYLPLQVIKAIVHGDAPPSAQEMETFDALHGRLAPPGDGEGAESVASLAARTGLPIDELRELAAVTAWKPCRVRVGGIVVLGDGGCGSRTATRCVAARAPW